MFGAHKGKILRLKISNFKFRDPDKNFSTSASEAPAPPQTFTIGVTDLSFNTMNAIYNRELRTAEGAIVTPEYWKQISKESVVDSWYWKKKRLNETLSDCTVAIQDQDLFFFGIL